MCTSTGGNPRPEWNPGDRKRVVSLLREKGLRLTAHREAVCEAVFTCHGHICAEHIQAVVASRRSHLRMNKTTVYRTLDLFLELGLVSEHRCADGRAQYEPAWRGRHSHLICRRCGGLVDLDEETVSGLREKLRSTHGFYAELESYPIFGLCSSCRG